MRPVGRRTPGTAGAALAGTSVALSGQPTGERQISMGETSLALPR